MKKIIALALAIVLVLALGVGGVTAANQPASKATANVGDIAILESDGMGWTTILEQDIKTPNGKDLFIDVSLETGLYTQTAVKSKQLVADTSGALAVIGVQVLVDDVVLAHPGPVVFDARLQQMTAKFAGMLEGAGADEILFTEDDEITAEELELILITMAAHSFNFIADDLEAGVHTIEVQAIIATDTWSELGTANAMAAIGNGSVTIELVRMIQDEDILELPDTS